MLLATSLGGWDCCCLLWAFLAVRGVTVLMDLAGRREVDKHPLVSFFYLSLLSFTATLLALG